MTNTIYIAAPDSCWPLGYAEDEARAQRKLLAIQSDYPDAAIVSCEEFWRRNKQSTLRSFPLSRVTEQFHDDMLGVLPPVYRRGHPGFFISEAATQSVHAQFIAYNGRYYGGYADISSGGRCWTHADIDALEASAEANTPTLSWYPQPTKTPTQRGDT